MNRPSAMPAAPAPRAAFTLIELLVVVGIVSLLSAFGVAMLDTRASALLHAGGELADLSALARENALSQNAPTALLVVTNAAAADASLNSRAVTLIQMDPQRNWSQIAKWTILPSAVVVTNSSASALPVLPTAGGSQILKLKGKPLDVARCGVAYLFDTDGRLVGNGADGADPARMRVAAANASGPAAKNYYELVFNANTGTYKIFRP